MKKLWTHLTKERTVGTTTDHWSSTYAVGNIFDKVTLSKTEIPVTKDSCYSSGHVGPLHTKSLTVLEINLIKKYKIQ